MPDENPEQERLRGDATRDWRFWGPYVSDRQWGTVREDYSADGDAWDYFPFDASHRRAYRWGEDGIFGLCDHLERLCFALTMWNGHDDRLKERFFGLSNPQGNHGEDGKEYYYFLDNVPSHAYMRALYRYPHAAFPYAKLIEENARRTRAEREYELVDTGIFDDNAYFDIEIEYAKASPRDILVRITATNRGNVAHDLHILPTLWFRNQWAWETDRVVPTIERVDRSEPDAHLVATHAGLGTYHLYARGPQAVHFTDNETNFAALFGSDNTSPFTKDGIGRYVVEGERSAINAENRGTKAAAHYHLTLDAGASSTMLLRLTDAEQRDPFGTSFQATFDQREAETETFYEEINPFTKDVEARSVQRQAFAGLLWSKQFYNYNVLRWLEGDPTQPTPPESRLKGRNAEWGHFDAASILSMPDTWEYPWFASWDLAFHTVAFAMVDPAFAKSQLILLAREWFMHPQGQMPAYEWSFGDVNPPVHAWAALRIYQIEQKEHGKGDINFLERIFQKLLVNFTWWINRKDSLGNNIFQGGFLGLDNIGLFDRSQPLPVGGYIDQSDGTSWMGVYALNMLAIAVELAMNDSAYEDIATKFFEHFLYIAQAINRLGGSGLYDHDDGLYYDMLMLEDGQKIPLKIHSMVSLLPLLAVEILEPEVLDALPSFRARMDWFIKHRPDMAHNVASMNEPGVGERRLLSLVGKSRGIRLLNKLLDEDEFLSPHGIRALSRYHLEHPYVLDLDGQRYTIGYEPAESTEATFGGNSNWRGPVWMPLNFLIIEALQRYHYYFGNDFKVECPSGSGKLVNLWDVASELSARIIGIFVPGKDGRRPVYGDTELFQTDPQWRKYPLFYEYFNGDNGAGLGAGHQTGWTALVAKLIEQRGEYG